MGEELKGKVGLDITAFAAAITKAKGMALQFGTAVGKVSKLSGFAGAAASAISIGAVTSGISSLLEKADGIDALAKRFDLTAEAVQAIQYAADQSGASAESMFVALKKINVAQQEALNGNKETAAAFAGLGVTMDDLRSKNFEQLFYQIGNQVNGASLETVKMSDAIKVMGRGGDEVLGAMRDGFSEVARNAKAAGVVIQNDYVKALADAKDKLGTLSARFTVVGADMLIKALGAAAKVLDQSLVGWYSRAAGALSAGASLSESMRTASEAPWVKELNELMKVSAKSPSGKTQAAGVSDVVAAKKPELGRISIPSMNLTSNQQIGAYSSQNPFLNRQLAIEQAMLDLQRKVAKATEDTARSTAEVARKIMPGTDFE